MECGVYLQDKAMAPLQQSCKLKNNSYVKLKAPFGSQNSKNGTKRKENVVKEYFEALDLNKATPHSSKSLRSSKSVVRMTHDLTEMEISNDEFAELPEFSDSLKNLRSLIIHNNAIRSLPSTVVELTNLQILNLSHNKLKELPSSLSELKNLEVLDLSCNKLENLPASYSKFQKLKQLDISKNNFKSIPGCVETGMGTLKVLNISYNSGAKINVIPCSKYIERFEAKCNEKCNKFPDWILSQKYFNFKECNLDKTTFDIYSFVGKEGSVNIRNFSMKFSNLSSAVLNVMIENMVNLEILNFGNENNYNSGNIFDSIPITVLKNPEFIQEIDFRGTAVSYIPNSINNLCNLRKLDVGLNNISWLPEEFCELQNLEHLKIDGNNLIMLPENIGNLKSLKKIRLENNSLTNIPKSFTNLKNLILVDLYNNLFEEVPSALLEMNNLEYLDLEQNYCATDDVKIGQKLYSTLRENFRSDRTLDIGSIFNKRINGVKRKPFVDDSDDDKGLGYSISYSDDESYERDSVTNRKKSSSEIEENWDSLTDSDDEFEPGKDEEIRYVQRSRMYVPTAHGFCPADLHSGQIKAEVASMRAYGSLPTYKEEEGQFDDA